MGIKRIDPIRSWPGVLRDIQLDTRGTGAIITESEIVEKGVPTRSRVEIRILSVPHNEKLVPRNRI